MTLDSLVLHARTRQFAEKFAEHLPHGLIIDGASGSGVVAVAKALASHVGSPEFVILPKKKVRNEPVVDLDDGSVLIEDVRQLYEQTRTRQSGSHVYILDTGNKSMTIAAQNAFLKLLEEPREGVHFVIATHQYDQLLPTVRSRCQRLTLLPITDNQTTELIESLGLTDTTTRARLAFVGRGRPALIKRLHEDSEAYDARVKIMTDAKTLLGADTFAKLKLIHTYRESRPDALTLLDDMNYQLQTVLAKQPDTKLVKEIEKHLETRRRIAAGGNIRLQLTSDVL